MCPLFPVAIAANCEYRFSKSRGKPRYPEPDTMIQHESVISLSLLQGIRRSPELNKGHCIYSAFKDQNGETGLLLHTCGAPASLPVVDRQGASIGIPGSRSTGNCIHADQIFAIFSPYRPEPLTRPERGIMSRSRDAEKALENSIVEAKLVIEQRRDTTRSPTFPADSGLFSRETDRPAKTCCPNAPPQS